jgi:PPOX class probable F420-dependent enzyme
MAPNIATTQTVDLDDLLEFVRPRHQWVLGTVKRSGWPQLSPVTGGVTDDGSLTVASYPERDKCRNIRRNSNVTICVLSDHFGGAWVQVDGRAHVIDMPDAVGPLVDYYRAVSGEHPDWDEYREAMHRQNKSLISIEPIAWGPIATGGFPASVASMMRFAESPDD